MGIYAKYVLPHLIDLAMRTKDTTRLRAERVPKARGDVLEIGIGSGLNLPFYSSEVRRVYGVDPSLELQPMAAKKVFAVPFQVSFLLQSAEEPLPLENASIDTVVVWKCIGGGCHLNRKIDGLISGAGFQISELKTFYIPGPRPMTYTYEGMAQIV